MSEPKKRARLRAGVSRQKLSARLDELKAAGVAEATFFEDGRLASVRFDGTAEQPDSESAEPPLTNGARRALQVLRGQRKDMTDGGQS